MLSIDDANKKAMEPGEAGEDACLANEIEVRKRQGVNVEQKKYTLNDLEALRKKMKKSDLKPAIFMTNEL